MNTPNETRHALPIGYQLENYQIKKVLGCGGFGITYLAEDTLLNTLVAIKEYLPPDLASREQQNTVQPLSAQVGQHFQWGLTRFLQEAKTLAQFKHPNIVRVLRFFEQNNTAYIVMEYEQGSSLDKLIRQQQTATEAEIKTILPPLLDGLAKVHAQGVLHRDIKPANIYLRDDHSPVLLDFGAAKYETEAKSRSVTSIVSAGYAPYEQYETKGNQQGAWSDIYALGAVLYRLVTGNTPIEAPERIGQTLQDNPDPLVPASQLAQGQYAEHLLRGIDWALEIKIKKRPQSIAEWRGGLLSSKETVESEVISIPQHEIKPITPLPTPSKMPAVLAAILGLLIVGGGVGYFGYTHYQQQLAEQAELQVKLEDGQKALAQEKQRQAEEQARLAAQQAERERQLQQQQEALRLAQEKEVARREAARLAQQEQDRERQRQAEEQARLATQRAEEAEARLRQQREALRLEQEQAKARCTDGRLNATQIKKLVTDKIAIGRRIDVSTPYLWREAQASNGYAAFQKEKGKSIEGKWKISGNKLCWCYGDCREYDCKYVEARNNCSVWYYTKIDGTKTGKISQWIDID